VVRYQPPVLATPTAPAVEEVVQTDFRFDSRTFRNGLKTMEFWGPNGEFDDEQSEAGTNDERNFCSVNPEAMLCMTDGCENERSENQQVCPDCKNGLIAFNMEREPIGLTPPNTPGNEIHQAHHGGAAMVLGAFGLLNPDPYEGPVYRNMNQDNPGAPAYHGP
jgi:hypothetical protein